MSSPPPGGAPLPARDLLLLRHAKASRTAEVSSDFDRPLTRRGRRDAPRMARWIRTHDLVPDCLVVSPARRTRETAELLLDELGLSEELARWDERIYDAEVSELLRALADAPEEAQRLMLVGHNPGLEDLVRHLAGATVREPEKGKFLPTCALAQLQVEGPWSGLRAGAAPLVRVVSWSRGERQWRVRAGNA